MTPHELQHLFIDDMYLCACGNPEDAVELVRQILSLMPLYENREKFDSLLPDDGAQHLVLGLMTHARLIEHGSTIGGSWITEKGEDVLKSLNEIEYPEIIFDDEITWQTCPRCDAEGGAA